MTRPPHPAFDLAPAFSADGRRLAYLACGSTGGLLPALWPERCVVRVTEFNEAGIPATAARTVTTAM